MAIVTYIEKDGQRIDVTGLEPVSEWRCDDCGEFLAEGQRMTATISIEAGVFGEAVINIDAHQNHLVDAIKDHAYAALTKLLPF